MRKERIRRHLQLRRETNIPARLEASTLSLRPHFILLWLLTGTSYTSSRIQAYRNRLLPSQVREAITTLGSQGKLSITD